MTRCLSVLLCVLLILSLVPCCLASEVLPEGTLSTPSDPVVRASAPDYDGLAYWDVSCSLGNIRLYLPYGVELASFQLVDGALINKNSSTVYLYCPQFPNYTFTASRFSPVSYRDSNYGNTMVLSGVEISGSSDILESYYPVIVTFCIIFIVLILIWKGRK